MKMKRSAIVGAAVVVPTLAIGGAAYAVYAWNHHTRVIVGSAGATEPTVVVSGQISGMLPGMRKPLTVTVGNANTFAVKVTDMSGGSAATASGCPAYAVIVVAADKTSPDVVVPPGSSKSMQIQVEMQKWADQRCGGQMFVLDLHTSSTMA